MPANSHPCSPAGRGASGCGERIRDTVERHDFKAGATSVRLTVSIGLASCPKAANSSRDLLMAADKALYKAKGSGKNKIVITASIRAAAPMLFNAARWLIASAFP